MLETLSQAAGYGRETRTITARRGIELHHVTTNVTTKRENVNIETQGQQQTAAVYERVTSRPRNHLEAVESAARRYFAAQRDGTRPQVVQAREALRLLLGEAAPEPPLVKPWDS